MRSAAVSVASIREERVGKIAGFASRTAPAAPPSKADGTPNGLAPVLQQLSIAALKKSALVEPTAAFTDGRHYSDGQN